MYSSRRVHMYRSTHPSSCVHIIHTYVNVVLISVLLLLLLLYNVSTTILVVAQKIEQVAGPEKIFILLYRSITARVLLWYHRILLLCTAYCFTSEYHTAATAGTYRT